MQFRRRRAGEVFGVIVCLSIASMLAAASPQHAEVRSPVATISRPTPSTAPTGTTPSAAPTVNAQPPDAQGYFSLRPVGAWSSLPDGATCTGQVHRSSWEPRPDNRKRNHLMPDPAAVHQSFATRPVGATAPVDPRWDSWLLQRVDGQFTGTTDEIFQWAACKWGLADNLVRAVAVQESTWYQYETYPSGRPVIDWGSGDMMPPGTDGAAVYCRGLAQYGYDYQRDFGPAICPETFSIMGVKSWQSPAWGAMAGNQNGTFPFSRDSTAFAVDYLASQLRGCYEGWEHWLGATGTKNYAAGDIWGCVGVWYAGEWHSAAAEKYRSEVEHEEVNHTWLEAGWPRVKPSCDRALGCPGPDPL